MEQTAPRKAGFTREEKEAIQQIVQSWDRRKPLKEHVMAHMHLFPGRNLKTVEKKILALVEARPSGEGEEAVLTRRLDQVVPELIQVRAQMAALARREQELVEEAQRLLAEIREMVGVASQ